MHNLQKSKYIKSKSQNRGELNGYTAERSYSALSGLPQNRGELNGYTACSKVSIRKSQT
jgi:hypothetical protein